MRCDTVSLAIIFPRFRRREAIATYISLRITRLR